MKYLNTPRYPSGRPLMRSRPGWLRFGRIGCIELKGRFVSIEQTSGETTKPPMLRHVKEKNNASGNSKGR